MFFVPSVARVPYRNEALIAQAISVWTAILSLLLALTSGCHTNRPDPARTLAEKVAEIGCMPWADVEKNLAGAGERLDALSKDESENADHALVMLMGYYLGEHNGEELVVEIVRRGNRMKPLLIREKRDPVLLSTCAPRNKAKTVKDLADEALKMIDQNSAEHHTNH